MSVPAWLLDSFAGVMLVVAAVSAARLAITWQAGSRRPDPDADIDLSHLLMGIAMAGTLAASLSTLPSRAWEFIFAALTMWFAYRVTREYRAGRGLRALVSEHHAPHLLHSAAMLYMFLALRLASGHAGSSAMAGMTAAGGQALRLPTLALLFAFLLCGYVVADLDRLPAPRWLHSTTTPALAFAGPAALATAGAPAAAPAAATATAGAGAGAPACVGAPAPRAPGLPASPATSPNPEASPAPAAPPVPEAPGLGRLLSPGVARGCRIAMGVTMAFMLIIMI
jgi:hypothetical protein